jgi:hypothetical protein
MSSEAAQQQKQEGKQLSEKVEQLRSDVSKLKQEQDGSGLVAREPPPPSLVRSPAHAQPPLSSIPGRKPSSRDPQRSASSVVSSLSNAKPPSLTSVSGQKPSLNARRSELFKTSIRCQIYRFDRDESKFFEKNWMRDFRVYRSSRFHHFARFIDQGEPPL